MESLFLPGTTPDGFRSKSRVKILEGKSWTIPSLANGILIVRDFNEMVALRMTASAD